MNAKVRSRRRRRAQAADAKRCAHLTEVIRPWFIARMPGGPHTRLQSFRIDRVRDGIAYGRAEVIDSGDWLRNVNVSCTIKL